MGNFWETAKVFVPAIVYTVQTNLLFIAINYLDAPTYQITYQVVVPNRRPRQRRVDNVEWPACLLRWLWSWPAFPPRVPGPRRRALFRRSNVASFVWRRARNVCAALRNVAHRASYHDPLNRLAGHIGKPFASPAKLDQLYSVSPPTEHLRSARPKF